MSERSSHPQHLSSFPRLFRRLRADTPLRTLARNYNLDPALLRGVETGKTFTDEQLARDLLAQVFALDQRDVDRLILGVRLYDLGLRDNAIRPLVVDAILKTLPAKARRQLRHLCQSYSSVQRGQGGFESRLGAA